MSIDKFAADVAAAVVESFLPLTSALADDAAMATLLNDLGWSPPDGVVDSKALAPLADAATAVTAAASAVEQYRSGDAGPATVASLLVATGKVVTALQSMTQPQVSGLPDPWGQTAFWASLAEDLAALLIAGRLRRASPTVFALLLLAGVFSEERAGPDDPSGRVEDNPYWQLHWDRLSLLLTDPAKAAAAAYGWRESLDTVRLLRAIDAAACAFGLPSAIIDGGLTVRDAVGDIAGDQTMACLIVRVPIFTAAVDGADSDGAFTAAGEVGFQIVPIPASPASTAAAGVLAGPYAAGTASATLALSPTLSLVLSGAADTGTAFGVAIVPDQVRFVGDPAAVQAGLGIRLDYIPSGPVAIAGDPDATGLSLQATSVGLTGLSDAHGVEVEFAAKLTGLRISVDLGDGDGFIVLMTGGRPVSIQADLAITWSNTRGLGFDGLLALDRTVPLDLRVGPLRLTGLRITAGPGDSGAGIRIGAGISAGIALGPFQASIEGVGAALVLRSDPKGLLFGMMPSLAFQPPRGIGLALDVPSVTGGGFLLFDPAAGQYAGVFELTIVGTVSVKAIAIITTKMPDGSPGFALLILITAEGFTPIQLGLGFSLTGIGGLLALNHTVDADAVRGGLRSGVLDSVLFVKDPVKNAPRVISTLNHVFPLAADRLLIGPLAEISWGTPPLVKIRLALLLEVPQPIRVILLAALSMMLPTPQDAVVEIHIDSIGVLDFGRRELALDASLHDSRILQFTLTGDMALRLNWGDEPTFVVSIGGFHPKFTPPKGLRPLNRLALTLSSGDNPRVRFEAYLALTSNTIQMGARVDVHAEEGPFALDGGGSFDALIQWSPFSLDVAFAAWAKITSGGSTLLAASVALEVTGPRPWHLTGQASVQVLAFTATVGVDLTVGAAPSTPEVTETVDVGAEIWAQLSDPARWAATLPPTATPGVTLAGLPVASGTAPLVAHPLATVSVREQIAPLGAPIERVGGRLPVGGTRSYTASVSAPAGVAGGTVTELFAPGQYANLPDDARLAGPSFAPMTGGLSLTPQTAAAAGPVLSCDLAVQTLDVTSLDAPATPGAWVAAEAGTARGPVPAPAPPMGQVTT